MATVLKLKMGFIPFKWMGNSVWRNILQSLTQLEKVIAGVESTDFVSLSDTGSLGPLFFIARELQAQDGTNQERSSQMAENNNN